jgi:putative peptide maturation dehydrogenase
MRLRRCAIVLLEPRERTLLDLRLLGPGGNGLRTIVEWVALAPQLASEVVLSPAELAVLGSLSPSAWTARALLEEVHPPMQLDSLVEKGLLVAEGSPADARDRVLRQAHWRALPAAMHYASRWQGVDTEAAERLFEATTRGSLLDRLGPPPPVVAERGDPANRRSLPAPADSPLGRLLDARVTCRNFAPQAALSLDDFASVLQRAFGARAVQDYLPGIQLLKKGVPSAGGLHATEAYLLVQRVAGVEPGLYHYHPVAHALSPLRMLAAADARDLARRLVAAQDYFADAQAMVFPCVRFRRTFWKYRNHAKAYRALVLDVGHLSQALYLAATEHGLAAFITAAINEVDVEQAFGLDPLEEGPLAACGFGIRADTCREVEFDPLGVVWPTPPPATA